MPEAKRPPLIAWLLGYLSHYTADLVVHPVIEKKVGPYERAQIPHRRLEMYQDAFAFSLLGFGQLSDAELIKSGIKLCTTPAGSLDPDLAMFWSDVLSDVHPEEFQNSKPQINSWHRFYTGLIDNVAEEYGKLPPYSGWLSKYFGLSYPRLDEVNDEHLKNLPTPEGPMEYRPILDRAINQTAKNWAAFSQACYGDSDLLRQSLGDWDMGTGLAEKTRFVYWKGLV